LPPCLPTHQPPASIASTTCQLAERTTACRAAKAAELALPLLLLLLLLLLPILLPT